MPISRTRRLVVAAALSGAALPVMPAQAQSQAVGAAEADGDVLVVTARRREERLTDVPLAVSAMSADTIERRQIDSLAQVGEAIPNMTFQAGAPTGSGGSTASIFIRGVGSSETSLGTEPGVGLYVDDVYIARSVGSVLDLVDIASVQVLRGPQGTLFGRNSLGGAILVRTARPDSRFGGYVEAKTGRYDRADLRGAVNLPFSDTLRLNVAAMTANRDGYVRSHDSKAMGNIDRVAARGVLEWQASADLKITLTGDITDIDETAMPGVLLGLVPNIPGTPVPSSIEAVSNLQAACGGASVLGNSGNPACIDQQFIRGPFATAGGYRTDNAIFDSQGSRPFDNTTRLRIRGASGHLEWQLSDALTLKSITAYRTLDAFWASNSDHSANPGIETKNDQNQDQFTQELQLLGKGSGIDWVAGLFYMKEKGDALNVVAFPDVIFRSGGGFATRSAAAFAQATLSVTDRLQLTAGLRFTHERKSFDTLANQQVIGVLLDPVQRIFLDLRDSPVPFVTGATPDLEANELTPTLNLSYRWMPDVMTYASWARGYKSGGYEQRLAPGTPSVPRFAPEFVDSFEIGLKASLLDRQLQFSAAAFYSDYRDMQISVVDGPAPTLTNAGDATLKGLEAELTWRPTPIATITAFGAYLDAGYDRLTQRALMSGITLASRLPSTSEWQVGASIGLDIPLGGSLTLRPGADWSYRASLYVDSANTPVLRQPGYHLLNAAITLAVDDRLAISLGGRNLTNATYLVAGLAQYNIGEIEGQYARPREWSLGARYTF
ncbi:TonB-dependent receptor [Sphingomonas flavalba]|uniref:TonB-dependent receptor n=1 Tax=Sphingomonas flavalba TaxID=2559804 RepID=UPI00109E0EA8|nr:TonB-dependent receptor [Sphingomonas flavalba]